MPGGESSWTRSTVPRLDVSETKWWILTGVAPNKGPATLRDIEFAIQTEIPLVSNTCRLRMGHSRAWVEAERFNRVTGQTVPLL